MKNSSDKRRQGRQAASETVRFSVVGSFSGQKEYPPQPEKAGTIVDTSEHGLGILTDTPLEPGMLLRLDGSTGPVVGVVMWTVDMGSRYRIGLKYV